MVTAAIGRAAVDPRLRRRRVAVRRARGRRRLRILLAGVAILGVVGAAFGLSRSRFLDLDTIEIVGVPAARQAAIAEAVPVALGTPLVDFDTRTVAAAVSALPWVQSVEVTRSWPDSLHVAVVERIPVAALPDGLGGFVLVDPSGLAISTTDIRPDGELPVIDSAPQGDLGDVQTGIVPALAVVEAMPEDLLGWVEAVTVEDDGGFPRLGLDLVGSARADLGEPRHVADKLDALRTVLASVDRGCMQVIDVRVANYATVQRDPFCSMTSAVSS